jgi:SulP family sulfate permease
VTRAQPASDASASVARAVSAGLVVGALIVAMTVSIATLVFGGFSPSEFGHGIRMALLAAAIGTVAVALVGSVPGLTGLVQDAPAAVLGTVVIGVLAMVPSDADPSAGYATVLALVALTTLGVGLAFTLLGTLRLGRLVRYLPYPVVGGFVAGTGWLLLAGGVQVGVGTYPADLAGWLAADVGGRLSAVLGVGALLATSGRWRFGFPSVLAATIVAFFGAMWATGADAATWRDAGLLFDAAATTDGGVTLLGPDRLMHVHWPAVIAHLPTVATAVLISTLGLSFNVAGLEVVMKRRIVLDKELRAAGYGNLVAAAFGGAPGYPALSSNALMARLGGTHRATSWLAAMVVGIGVAAGPALVAWVPAPVVGAVLASLGLVLLREWVVDAVAKLSRIEYGITLVILLTIASVGLLPGVLVGLVLAVLLFVVSYGRIDAVKHVLTGTEARSRVRWDAQERRELDARGASRLVIQLQGYLFFGVAYAVFERVDRRLRTSTIDELILDFHRVTGMDATALAGLGTLRRAAAEQGVRLTLADVPDALTAAMERAGLRPSERTGFEVAPSLDAALERAERRVLTAASDHHDPFLALEDRLDALTEDDLEISDLAPHLERVELAAGERLHEAGHASDGAVHLVASGGVTTWLDVPGHAPMRLETVRGGRLVGDVGFYADTARGRSRTVADEPTVLYRLTRRRLAELTDADPALAAAVHRLAARQLAQRAAHLSSLVRALQR